MEITPEAKRVREMLQRIPIFGGIAEGALQHILERAKPIAVRQGMYLFRENDPVGSMFVITDGLVAVTREVDECEYELSRLEPGDCVGELELIDLRPRAASVRALKDCRAIEISETLLHEIYQVDAMSFAMIHMNMGREVSRRLRQMDADMLKVRVQSGSTTEGEETMMSDHAAPPATPPATRCKVCTKHLQPDEEHWDVWYGISKYAVCCPLCAEQFRKEPELFLAR